MRAEEADAEPRGAGASAEAKGARGAEPAGRAGERSRRGFGLPAVRVSRRPGLTVQGKLKQQK